jgi:hypothetical protein
VISTRTLPARALRCAQRVTAQTELLDKLLGQRPLAIGDLILAEVLQGFEDERDFNDARRLLTSLLVVELGGQEIAIQAAKNFRELRRRGVTPVNGQWRQCGLRL